MTRRETLLHLLAAGRLAEEWSDSLEKAQAEAEIDLQEYDRERDQERGTGREPRNPCRVCGSSSLHERELMGRGG